MEKIAVKNVDEYIGMHEPTTRVLLEQLRSTILKAAPKAEEVISYGMPAFKFYGILVYFAAHKNHIGFYPTSSPIKFFSKELERYKTSKGGVQFPIGNRLPIKLISDMVKFRVKQNLEKQQAKKSGKK